MAQEHKKIGPTDMYMDHSEHSTKWITAERGANRTMKITLIECEVDDPDRFSFYNGSWWKASKEGR